MIGDNRGTDHYLLVLLNAKFEMHSGATYVLVDNQCGQTSLMLRSCRIPGKHTHRTMK